MDPIVAVDSSLSTSSASSMCTILDTIITVQVAHGQLLLALLNEIAALWVDLANTRGSTPPTPPSDES